jgi:SAM-dependent methyltransferase
VIAKIDLLSRFIQTYPAQPATAYWRAVEIDALAQAGLPQGRGLDLGCGDGKLTDILFELTGVRELVGIDPDPKETRAAARYPFYARVHTTTGDKVPEPDGAFDFVISNSVLEHIPNLEATIAEVGRLLKPGGRFYFTVPQPAFHDNLAGALFGLTDRARYLERLDARIAHFNYLTAEDWSQLCGRHGLEVRSCRGYLDRGQTRRWETLSRMTGGLLYALAGQRWRPIEIQRALGARAMQNAAEVPKPVAAALARFISLGASTRPGDPWTSAATASCLLVEGVRS